MSSDDGLTSSDRPAGNSHLAVIAALGVEYRCLRNRTNPFRLIQSGPGPLRAANAAQQAIDDGATALLSWGLAGALVPELAAGSIVLPRSVISDTGFVCATSPEWRDQIETELRGHRVYADKLLTIAKTLLGPADKVDAASRFGAIACDMESAAIADVAVRAGARFVAIRVIADGLYDRLPERVETFVDGSGNSRIVPLICEAMHPGQWKAIATIARRFSRARHSLSGIAERLAPRAFGC